MQEVDKRNTKRMKAIVAKYGWPTKRMVGGDGARAAWLLVQHADHAVAFQRQCLTRLLKHKDTGQVSDQDIAYLTDRVRVNEGKPQTYGTQFHVFEGVRQPRPIHDPDDVEKRRKSMGLPTLKEYTDFMNT